MARPDGTARRALGAILLNPPLTTGAATMRNLHVAADVLRCDGVQVANLFTLPTTDVAEINQVGRNTLDWERACPALEQVLMTSHAVVAGWGVSGLYGPAGAHRRAQAAWVIRRAASAPHLGGLWTLNGEPRHPSRWHQYVSDRHGRTSGASLRDRLASVLRFVDFVPTDLHADDYACLVAPRRRGTTDAVASAAAWDSSGRTSP
ncbi:DUF1643 domain-containing protein [Micromonospora sp. DT63]|uniref:DUF1643 domain-containing protein n=1 Tax=Micromonospora sp. DT63 TaxID=3393441 RepID=UPI003CE9B335